MNHDVKTVGPPRVAHVIQRQHHRPAQPGLAAQLPLALMHHASLVAPLVPRAKGAIVKNQCLPAGVPVEPQLQHGSNRHACHPQAQRIGQLNALGRV